MRCVVTGAAGFIGSHLAATLAASGHDVVGVDCFTDYYDPALKEENAAGLEVVRADLAEAPLGELLAEAEAVLHLAGQPGVRASWGADFALYARRNLVASHRVFEAAARAGRRVVFASSSSVYGDAASFPIREDSPLAPISAYGITKLACEHLARAYASSLGLDAVTLRYFTVYGPRQRPDMALARMAGALAAGEPFELYGDGSASREFTYVDDVAAATVAALERAPAGAVYNVGGGGEATMREVVGILERLAGRSLEIRFRPVAPGDVRRTAADTSRIRRELGWRPRVSLEDGLRAQWEWASARVAAR